MSAAKRGANWTLQEDEALCLAWLKTSQDASIGINQRAQTLYDRVSSEFVRICYERSVPGNPELRASPGIKARWLHINKMVSKFAGCIAQIENRCQSGASPKDTIKQAVSLFAESEKTTFSLMHCYVILQNAPKWQQYHSIKVSNNNQKRSSANIDMTQNYDTQTSSSSRPMGQKAAKARKNATENAGLEMAKAGRILAAAAKEKTGHSKQKAKALTRIANHTIMSVNLEGLSETAREYYVLEQQRILNETRALSTKEEQELTSVSSDDDSWMVECMFENSDRENRNESDDDI